MYSYYTPQSDKYQIKIVIPCDNFLSKGNLFMDILSTIAERLNDLMNEADLTAKQVADGTGLSVAVISRILSCKRMPSYKTLITIADFFCCTTDYIVGRKDDYEKTTFRKCPPFNEQLDYLLKIFKISKYKLVKDGKLKEDTVNRWYKGEYKPTVENLIKLAKFFNCSIDFILGRSDY